MEEKNLPFVWRIEESHLVGTFHIIPYSFSDAIKKLLDGKKTFLHFFPSQVS